MKFLILCVSDAMSSTMISSVGLNQRSFMERWVRLCNWKRLEVVLEDLATPVLLISSIWSIDAMSTAMPCRFTVAVLEIFSSRTGALLLVAGAVVAEDVKTSSMFCLLDMVRPVVSFALYTDDDDDDDDDGDVGRGGGDDTAELDDDEINTSWSKLITNCGLPDISTRDKNFK